MKKENESSFTKYYQSEVRKIESRLNSLFKNKKPESLYNPCSYSLKGGGKRIRPMLVLFSAKSVNGKFNQVYNTATAVELLHTFTLVHDDIMDHSEKRRGRQTLHKVYDENTAILAGDSLVALAYENLLKDCSNNSKSVLSTFTRGITQVCEGQSLDKEFELEKDVTLNDYKVMIYKKTAALAEMCCSIGAQICEASIKEVKALSNYGKYLGMAFQIHDDLLDIIGNEKEFGKVIGSDLVEGKKTFLLLTALKTAIGKDKKILSDVILNKGIRKNDVKNYIDLYTRLGVIDSAREEIIRYTKQAIKYLDQLPNKEGRNLLNSFANSLIERSK